MTERLNNKTVSNVGRKYEFMFLNNMVLASGDNPCLNWLSLCYYSLKNTSLLSGKKFSNLTLYFFFSRLGISHVSKDS